MTQISDRFRRNADAFAQAIDSVPADRWGDASPCEGWTAADVVSHVVDGHGTFVRLVGREPVEGPAVADDPAGAFATASTQVLTDLEDPDRAGEEFDGFFGRTTFAQAVDRFLAADLTIHRWDLARATGGDDTIPDDEIARIWAETETWSDAMRSGGVFGPAIEPPADADEQTRLLCFLGRQP